VPELEPELAPASAPVPEPEPDEPELDPELAAAPESPQGGVADGDEHAAPTHTVAAASIGRTLIR
jgi:hypothetical protein